MDSSEASREPDCSYVHIYRKAGSVVVASYLGMEDAFVEALLLDQEEEYYARSAADRERMKVDRYDEYLTLLTREVIVNYAAVCAESLAKEPENALSSDFCLDEEEDALTPDDRKALIGVHEIFECLECPDEGENMDRALLAARHSLSHYYKTCASELVKNQLLSVIISIAENLFHRENHMDARQIQRLIFQSQERSF